MDLKDFKSGTYKQQTGFKIFSPAPINHLWTWSDPQLHVLLKEGES